MEKLIRLEYTGNCFKFYEYSPDQGAFLFCGKSLTDSIEYAKQDIARRYAAEDFKVKFED